MSFSQYPIGAISQKIGIEDVPPSFLHWKKTITQPKTKIQPKYSEIIQNQSQFQKSPPQKKILGIRQSPLKQRQALSHQSPVNKASSMAFQTHTNNFTPGKLPALDGYVEGHPDWEFLKKTKEFLDQRINKQPFRIDENLTSFEDILQRRHEKEEEQGQNLPENPFEFVNLDLDLQGMKTEEKDDQTKGNGQIENENGQEIEENGKETKEIGDKGKEIVENQDNIEEGFVDQYYENGAWYEGQTKNGQRHGKGKFYYQAGGIYDGEWRDGKINGLGTLYYMIGDIAYHGMWENEKFHGKGVIYNDNPEINDDFDFKDFSDLGEMWVKYQGEFENDAKHGTGTLYIANGDCFVGEFIEDQVHGRGIYQILQKDTDKFQEIKGEWIRNVLAEEF